MSKKEAPVQQVVLGLILLLVLGAAFVAAMWGLIWLVVQVDPNVLAAGIAGTATVLVSVITVVAGKELARREAVRQEQRDRKVEVYEDLIAFMFDVQMKSKRNETLCEQDMIEFMVKFTRRAMVWASDDVLAAWIGWRADLVRQADHPAAGIDMLFGYEQLILAIRRDIGHESKRFAKGDILRLFVNDVDKHLPGQSKPGSV